MANDRIYLVCVGCGDDKCIAKYYPRTGVYRPDHWDDKELWEWLEEHGQHNPFCGQITLHGEPGFRLETGGPVSDFLEEFGANLSKSIADDE